LSAHFDFVFFFSFFFLDFLPLGGMEWNGEWTGKKPPEWNGMGMEKMSIPNQPYLGTSLLKNVKL
jgi:hypothetical protein